MVVIAFFNGILVYPQLKRYYQAFYSNRLLPEDPTHFVSATAHAGLLKSNLCYALGLHGHLTGWEGYRATGL